MKNTHTSSDISFLHLSGEARLIYKGGAESHSKKPDNKISNWADDELARFDDPTFMSESNKHKQNIDWLENISKKNEKDLSKEKTAIIDRANTLLAPEVAKKKINTIKDGIANTLAGDSGTGSTYEREIKVGGSIEKALTDLTNLYTSSNSTEVMDAAIAAPTEFIDQSTQKKYKLEYNGSKFDLIEVNEEVEKSEPVVKKPEVKKPTNVDEANKTKEELEKKQKELKESNETEKGMKPVLKMIQTLLNAIMRFITGKKGEAKTAKPGSKNNPKDTTSKPNEKGGTKPKAKPSVKPKVKPTTSQPAQPAESPPAQTSAPNQAQDFEETPNGETILKSDEDILKFIKNHISVSISLRDDNSIVMYNGRNALAVIPNGITDRGIVKIRQYLVKRIEKREDFGNKLELSSGERPYVYLKRITGNSVIAMNTKIYDDENRDNHQHA